MKLPQALNFRHYQTSQPKEPPRQPASSNANEAACKSVAFVVACHRGGMGVAAGHTWAKSE